MEVGHTSPNMCQVHKDNSASPLSAHVSNEPSGPRRVTSHNLSDRWQTNVLGILEKPPMGVALGTLGWGTLNFWVAEGSVKQQSQYLRPKTQKIFEICNITCL